MLEEADRVRPLECSILLHHQQLSLQGDAAHRREMIARELFAKDGRLPDRSVGAYHRWQLVEAGLVHEHDRAPFLQGPFLSTGQRSCFQRLMAFSSRWFARRAGFCKESPNALSTRLTCAEW